MTGLRELVVDSSALMAVALDEPQASTMAEAMASARCTMSVGNWLEVTIVADSRSAALGARLDDVIAKAGIQRIPVTEQQADVAREAYRRFGKGSGSKARLNYGDCLAYALSITSGAPLLFVGDDFTHTDVSREHRS